jgi:pimeloyl-ACP methyl ester carboxylesterase
MTSSAPPRLTGETDAVKEVAVNILSSADGAQIAYGKRGEGPALILVDGAMCSRSSGSKPELAGLLSARFTVYSYDRRGRGDSGDTQSTSPTVPRDRTSSPWPLPLGSLPAASLSRV